MFFLSVYFILVFSIFIFITTNLIFSITSLFMVYICSCPVFIILRVEFLAIVIILIYLSALLVLFTITFLLIVPKESRYFRSLYSFGWFLIFNIIFAFILWLVVGEKFTTYYNGWIYESVGYSSTCSFYSIFIQNLTTTYFFWKLGILLYYKFFVLLVYIIFLLILGVLGIYNITNILAVKLPDIGSKKYVLHIYTKLKIQHGSSQHNRNCILTYYTI